ncbi:MAG: Helix-turn-helix domain [Verrucomicrobiota bacterium]|jgi:excisionase family DNA binding protein
MIVTDLLTKKQVAAYCGASVRTVERWMACDHLAVVRFNSRHIRFRREDVVAFIQSRLHLPRRAQS